MFCVAVWICSHSDTSISETKQSGLAPSQHLNLSLRCSVRFRCGLCADYLSMAPKDSVPWTSLSSLVCHILLTFVKGDCMAVCIISVDYLSIIMGIAETKQDMWAQNFRSGAWTKKWNNKNQPRRPSEKNKKQHTVPSKMLMLSLFTHPHVP